MALTEITNYIEDDWDDNALTSRTDATEGYFLHPSDNLLSGDYEAGDALKGVYRPDWKTSGTVSVSNSKLSLSGDTTYAVTNSVFNAGAWEYDLDRTDFSSANNGVDQLIFAFMCNNYQDVFNSAKPYNSYSIMSRGDDESYIIHTDGAANQTDISNVTGIPDQCRVRVTRDSYGNFEHFYDGSSGGTATDNKEETSQYIRIGVRENINPIIDNVVVK